MILVLKAFKSVVEVRQMVKDTFSDTPSLLENIERLVQLFPESTKLRDQAEEAYVALLGTIAEMIEWLKQHSCVPTRLRHVCSSYKLILSTSITLFGHH